MAAKKKAPKKPAKKAPKKAAKKLSDISKCKKVTVKGKRRTLCWDVTPIKSHTGYAIVSND